jgi:hypothetical protein
MRYPGYGRVNPVAKCGWYIMAPEAGEAMRILGAAALIGLVLAYPVLRSPPALQHPPGQIAPREPLQTMLDDAAPVQVGPNTLQPRARFEIEARVLSRERYWLGERAKLMPVDIAVGWAEMSDTALINRLSISQGHRFYYWSYSGAPPAPPHVIIRTSANMHLIPATPAVKDTLLAAREGDVLSLEGDLVDVQGRDWQTKTSLTREDTGNGACETIYVRSASIRSVEAK